MRGRVRSLEQVLEKGFYRHYKGGLYLVLGMANPKNKSEEASVPTLEAVEEATGRPIPIFLDGGAWFFVADKNANTEPLIIYQGKDQRVWARPISEFQSTVEVEGRGSIPRFETLETQQGPNL